MITDKAGHMLHVKVAQTVGRAYTEDDKKLIQNCVFYLQEIIKLFPQGAAISLIAAWEHGANQRETVNIGALSNTDVIALLLDVELRRKMENTEVQGNG